ncbi:MAG: hypothetical protein IPM53_01640 [Anaerolineaceae bacterium]|nr:hypothetical protein [Anaerolineaceae bacterium]
MIRSTPTTQRWGIFFVLGLAVLLLAGYLRHALSLTDSILGVPLDDAWIHFQYARNLSQGNGFSYVPGVPTPGSTAPLWTLLLAGVGLFTENFLLPALLLSAAFFLLTIWLTYRLTLDLTGQVGVALLAAAGLAVTGRMLWASWSAMEVTLFTALSVAAVWAYQRRGLGGVTAVLFALASQTRPEGHVLFALAVVDAVAAWRWPYAEKRPLPTWRGIAAAVLIYGAVQLPYALFSLSVTGQPLANTFYAKARQSTLYSWRTLRETLQYHWQDNWLALLLVPFSFPTLWRRNRLVGGWLVGLWLLLPFIVPFLWHHGRYTMPLIPFQMVAAAVGLHWLTGKLRRGWQPAWLAVAGLWLVVGLWTAPYWAGMLGYNAREILEIDVALGEWLAANVPAEATVAIDDIGAIVFKGPRPIVDLNGLVSPEMWLVLDDADPPTAAMRLLATSGVRYLAVFPDWHPALVSDPALARPVQRFTTNTHSIIFAQEAVVYEMDWPYRQSIAPQVEISALLGDAIQLRGFDEQTAGNQLNLTIYWESVTAVSQSYKVFIHLLDSAGNIVAQVDQPPVQGLAPTHRWQPGDLVRDPYQIHLPPDLPAGTYELRVGLYTDANGRLPVSGDDVVDNAVVLLRLEIGD